ncbi:unnamed protein product [Eruca vesicaria subsp. sativa]|uniref:Uncharacterized protein n=1 Tax=Eruca vesicaria subsp. sativa TaxID=29727 RepID=A0ABC8M7U8_ERUVS|nr:unnamed protein product [Eruca vesicaria subsp. sativa]
MSKNDSEILSESIAGFDTETVDLTLKNMDDGLEVESEASNWTGQENRRGPDAKNSPEIVETISSRRVKNVTTTWGTVVVSCGVGGGAPRNQITHSSESAEIRCGCSERMRCCRRVSLHIDVSVKILDREQATDLETDLGEVVLRTGGGETVVKAAGETTVGDGEDTDSDVEDDDRAKREQIGASVGVDDPKPAARGLAGVEKVCLRCCFGNRV